MHPEPGHAVAAARTAEDDLLALGLADHALRPLGAQREFHHLAQLVPVGDFADHGLRGAHPLREDSIVVEGVIGELAIVQRQHVLQLFDADAAFLEFGGVGLAEHMLAEEAVDGLAAAWL